MSDIAIRAEHLSKRYRLGEREPYKSLRDVIAWAASAPIGWVRGKGLAPTSPEYIWALDDVSFEVKQGEAVGIIGRNGAGKSTLLKILSRITKPTKGHADIYGRVGSLLEVGTGFHPELTGRENIYLNGAILGMKRQEIAHKFDEIVEFAEIERFLDTPVKRYSSGMYVRLAFAVAAHLEPEILLVDEVLAVGDAQFQKKCLGKMDEVTKEGMTVLFVSHNMASITKLCHSASIISKGKYYPYENIQIAIEEYLKEGLSNKKEYQFGPLKTAEIKQVEDKLILWVTYNIHEYKLFPCLGFVVSDMLGTRIFGSNPIIDGISISGKIKQIGKIQVVIKEPKLINGNYTISLWFGNGKEDIFTDIDALQFEVVNMASENQKDQKAIGFIFPFCEWNFE